MYAWIRRNLNLRQIALLAIAIFLAPLWILNYENLIQAIGLHRLLLDSAGAPVVIPAGVIEFLQSDPVKWAIIGGLIVTFLPLMGRLSFPAYRRIRLFFKSRHPSKAIDAADDADAHHRKNLSDDALGMLCIEICAEIHEYIFDGVEMAAIYDDPKTLRPDTWSEDIKRMQETARIDRAKFRKKFGSRLFYIEDELARRQMRRLALTERELDAMDERGQLADEIGAVGFRLRAGRKPKPPSGIT